MGNPVAERETFTTFLAAAPGFAGEAVQSWNQPKQDPPDVLCMTLLGRQVGLELTGWIDEDQIANAKSIKSIENSIRKAILPDPPNDTEHIHFAWLLTLPKARIRHGDAASFRAQLMQLVDEVDRRWDAEEEWHSPQGCWWRDFSRYPTVGKYLGEVRFFRDRRLENGHRRKARTAGSPSHCVAGHTRKSRWWQRWSSPCQQNQKILGATGRVGREFDLLLHYGLAWAYSSPVETRTFKIADAARASAEFIGDDPGAFDQIFLFVPHNDEQKVFRPYPRAE